MAKKKKAKTGAPPSRAGKKISPKKTRTPRNRRITTNSPTKIGVAREYAEKFPDTPNTMLGRMMRQDYPELYKDNEQGRFYARRARGSAGEKSRQYKMQPELFQDRSDKKTGTMECPPSLSTPWEPYELKALGKVALLSDVHIPYHDRRTLETVVNYLKKRVKPSHIFLNGDIADFYRISRWDKHPAHRDLLTEVDLTKQFLGWLRKEFPRAGITYKMGNHDERWNTYIWNRAPELWNIPQCQLDKILELDNLGIELVGDQRPVMLGKLPAFHGHELPRGISNPVNPARGALLRMAASVIIGHLHQTSTHTEYNWEKREVTCWSTGCLCDMNPEYARINKWNQGFALAEIFSDKSYDLNNLRVGEKRLIRSS